MKYLPRGGPGAYYEVTTTDPVRIDEGFKNCPHTSPSTHFSFVDLRSDDLHRYNGFCCTRCGWILQFGDPGGV